MKKEKKMYCNCCGREILMENEIVKEGIFSVEYQFGYFSEKDGQVHGFDLCEECYDKMTAGFKIPCTVSEAREYL
ncbi:hypothetical protein D7X88_17765 [bacterium C-53]|nr:hypothetical protein [Lachnospiraceae bacterium]NBI04791.1 hypothetical protein [Lachnospiraceae bacterium]RKJ07749.1 hypothetical protein D7X88_17765 [bacterium C-53]